jgi:predicted transcriptional regulator
MGTSNPIELAAEIVAAFVSKNPFPKGDLPSLIHAVQVFTASSESFAVVQTNQEVRGD